MRGRIVAKLAQLRERRVETFGSHAHGYALAGPLDEAEVRVLEQQHGIELPASYRAFLREVGASGAGPYYGLLPPARWGAALYGDVAMPDFASRACAWWPDARGAVARDEFDRVAGTLDEPFQGAITIADQGCAYYALLVTAGPARGRVMYVSLDGGAPFFPADVDFIAWYERWLDELLAGFRHFWYGTSMPGTEATFVAAARDADPKRRLDALGAMAQLPSLSPDSLAIIALRVRDDDAPVRAQALHLVKHRKLASSIEVHVRRALADVDPAVRRFALQSLIEANLDWHTAAFRAATDADETVASAAIRELEKAKALTDDALLPLLAAPATRLAAHYAARSVPSQRLFDAALAQRRADGDDQYNTVLHTLLAQVRLDAVDAQSREIVLDLLLAQLAAATGPEPQTIVINGLRAVARHTDACTPRALAALVELLGHAEPFFRFEACAALGELGQAAADALPALRALVEDAAMPRAKSQSTAWSVGENARRAIAKIEG